MIQIPNEVYNAILNLIGENFTYNKAQPILDEIKSKAIHVADNKNPPEGPKNGK